MKRRVATVFFVALLVLAAASALGAQGYDIGLPVQAIAQAPPPYGYGSLPNWGSYYGYGYGMGLTPRIYPFPNVQPPLSVLYPQQFYGLDPFYYWNQAVNTPPVYYAVPSYIPPIYGGPNYMQPPVSQTDIDLANEVQRLKGEIQDMRYDQASNMYQEQQQQLQNMPPPPSSPEEAPIPTTLIFRDNHRKVIYNYAIVGEALWVLDSEPTQKIPLSQLDLNATQRENRNLGNNFPLPRS